MPHQHQGGRLGKVLGQVLVQQLGAQARALGVFIAQRRGRHLLDLHQAHPRFGLHRVHGLRACAVLPRGRAVVLDEVGM